LLDFRAPRRKLGISAPTVAKSFAHMGKLGMLREITGKQRRRPFVCERYFAILNADG
jgi:Fic family protein